MVLSLFISTSFLFLLCESSDFSISSDPIRKVFRSSSQSCKDCVAISHFLVNHVISNTIDPGKKRLDAYCVEECDAVFVDRPSIAIVCGVICKQSVKSLYAGLDNYEAQLGEYLCRVYEVCPSEYGAATFNEASVTPTSGSIGQIFDVHTCFEVKELLVYAEIVAEVQGQGPLFTSFQDYADLEPGQYCTDFWFNSAVGHSGNFNVSLTLCQGANCHQSAKPHILSQDYSSFVVS